MNVHEYQAKEIFKRYGIPVNTAILAKTPQEVFQSSKELIKPDTGIAVKAQVHSGGRGRAGGVKVVSTPEEARDLASKLFGKKLITVQNGPDGQPVDLILVEQTAPIAKEYYVSIVLDRSAAKPCLIASEAGGMNIEEVAHANPEKLIRSHFSPETGLSLKQAEDIAGKFSGLTAEQKKAFASIFEALAKIFMDLDASLIEINPLAVMKSGGVIAIDAKINFDDNALYRHADIAALRDPNQEDSREVEAKKFDLSYVGLDGSIGCIVNGAGLAMATMDIIKYAGGEPANFLDVGGGAGKEKVAAAFKIILKDPKVKAILVNIFGGIMRCDVVAEGILAAIKEVGVQVPLVVRLEGTNVEEGKAILKQSGLKIISASEFSEAAEKVVGSL